MRALHGTVLGPDGQPAAGATVYWVGWPRPKRKLLPGFTAQPKEMTADRANRYLLLARNQVDAGGHFILESDQDISTWRM